MRTTHFLMSVLTAAGLAAGVCAAEKTAGKQFVQQNGAARLSALRLLTAATPGSSLQNWMTAGAWKRWNDIFGGMIRKDGKSPLLSDFFSNAIQMTGTQLETSGITGYYNPYQDTVMLIQTDNSDRIPRIEDFVFLSGPQFRGEKLAEKQYSEVLAPQKAKLDLLLVRNINAVRTIFEKDFPKGAKTVSLSKYRAIRNADIVKGVTDHATLHLLRLVSLFDANAKNDLLQVGKYSAILWEGDLQKIKKTFAFPGNDASGAEMYAKLDKEVRSSLLPCLYFRNKKGMLIGLASRIHPDFVILISAEGSAQSKPLLVFLPFEQKFIKDLYAAR